MIKCFAEHSVDTSLLNGGVVIDAGCRGFGFSLAMQELGMKVYALDIEDMIAPKGINFIKAALTDKRGEVFYVDTEDKQAKYISDEGTKPVKAITLEDLYLITGENVDVLKMDIEGCEGDVILGMTRPIPKQISFEMHQHTSKRKSTIELMAIFTRLSQWYDIPYSDYSRKHGLCENYWDVLCTRKSYYDKK
jgi:FkbM family methyltransferase